MWQDAVHGKEKVFEMDVPLLVCTFAYDFWFSALRQAAIGSLAAGTSQGMGTRTTADVVEHLCCIVCGFQFCA